MRASLLKNRFVSDLESFRVMLSASARAKCLRSDLVSNIEGKRNRGHNYCNYCGRWILGGYDWKHDKRIEHLRNIHSKDVKDINEIKDIKNTRITEHFGRDPHPDVDYSKE